MSLTGSQNGPAFLRSEDRYNEKNKSSENKYDLAIKNTVRENDYAEWTRGFLLYRAFARFQ